MIVQRITRRGKHGHIGHVGHRYDLYDIYDSILLLGFHNARFYVMHVRHVRDFPLGDYFV